MTLPEQTMTSVAQTDLERLNQRLDEAQAAIDSQAYFVPLWLDPTTLQLLRDLVSLATDQPAKPAQAE